MAAGRDITYKVSYVITSSRKNKLKSDIEASVMNNSDIDLSVLKA
jgi:hypothetical protein